MITIRSFLMGLGTMGLNIFRSFTRKPIGIIFGKGECLQIPSLARTRRLGIESSLEWGFVWGTIIYTVTERRRTNEIGMQIMELSPVLGILREDRPTARRGQ